LKTQTCLLPVLLVLLLAAVATLFTRLLLFLPARFALLPGLVLAGLIALLLVALLATLLLVAVLLVAVLLHRTLLIDGNIAALGSEQHRFLQ